MKGIDRALALFGRPGSRGSAAKLAEVLGIERSAVSQWKTSGLVPAARALQLESLFGVPRSAFNPHAFPPAPARVRRLTRAASTRRARLKAR